MAEGTAIRTIELKYVVGGQDEYAQGIKAINDLTASTDKETQKANSNISKSFRETGNNMLKAFEAAQVSKSIDGIEKQAKKLGLSSITVFENVTDAVKGTVVSLEEQRKALLDNAAAAGKLKVSLLNIPTGQPIGTFAQKPTAFNVKSELVPGAQTSKIPDQTQVINKNTEAKKRDSKASKIPDQTQVINKNTEAKKRDSKETKNLADNTRTLIGELSVLKDQIARGLFKGDELVQAQKEAAQLQSQIANVNKAIKVSASNTFAFDALADGAQKATAVFGLLQGVTALVGSENEDLHKTLVKLTAIQAISNGLLEINKFLKTENAAKTGLLTIAEKANSIATVGATSVLRLFGIQATAASISLKVLRGALLGLGIAGALALISALVSAFSEASKEVGKLGDEYKETKERGVGALEALIAAQLDLAAAQGKISELKKQQITIDNQLIKSIKEERKARKEASDQILKDVGLTFLEFNKLNDYINKGLSPDDITRSEFISKNAAAFQIARAAIDKVVAESIQTELTLNATAAAKKGTVEIVEAKKTSKELLDEAKKRDDADKKRDDAILDLEKKRILAELAAERAKYNLIVALTKEGSALNQQAIIDRIEFELRATKIGLDLELKERRKALEESGVASEADYIALDNEINARRVLSEQETINEINQLNQAYRDQSLKDEKEFQDKMKQIELDRIKVIQDATTNADRISQDRRLSNARNKTTQGTQKRVDAEAAIIKNGAKKQVEDEVAATKERTKGLIEGTQERIRIEDESNERIKTINQDATDAINANQRAQIDETVDYVASSLQTLFSSITEIQNNLLNRQLNDLDAMREADLKNTELTAAQKAQIEEKYAKKAAAIRLVQAKNERSAALFSAALNVSVNIAKALGNPLQLALVIALGAAQIAAIATRPLPKFAKGKVKIDGEGTSTSDSIHAMISKNESVINARSTGESERDLIAINKSREAFMNHVNKAYIQPALMADRMRTTIGSRQSTSDQRSQKIEVKTDRLERRVLSGQRQAKKDAKMIADKISENNYNPRNQW